MPEMESDNERKGCRSCASYGCMGMTAVFLAMVLWIASGFVIWKQCKIPLPDGAGYVTYMARLNKIICAEWDRKVYIERTGVRRQTKWIPCDTCGASPVNVYWYPAHGRRGPYLRMKDPLWEYLVDVKHGTAMLIVRYSGNAYVGELLKPFTGYEISDSGSETSVTVEGRPARKLESFVADHKGTYIGRINDGYWRFIPVKESPERTLPKH